MHATIRLVGLLWGLTLASSCEANRRHADADGGDGKADSGTHDAGGEVGGVLQTLSLAEAPAPTREFFWGPIDVTAPNKAGEPIDTFTIAVDADQNLRYLSWKTIPCFPKTFGDATKDFPLRGMKRVDTHPEYNSVFEVTVDDTPPPTASSFLLRMRVVATDPQVDGITDYVESTQGTRAGEGWKVVYAAHGKFRSAVHDVDAQGTLYPGDPNAGAPSAEGSRWSAPVELEAPGFAGPPVDHLTVELDPAGQPRSFGFERFRGADVTFGSGEDDIPLSGTATRRNGDVMITVDDAVAPTGSHFVIRYRAVGHQNTNHENTSDYVEGLDGTRSGDRLIVRYFIKGKLWGASIDAHAAGTLVPASVSP